MPLYIVKSGEGPTLSERLVEANNKATARGFVARDHFSVEIADPKDLFRLARDGKDIEVATGEPVIAEPVEPSQIEELSNDEPS